MKIKLRQGRYCNLKLLLICLVVYGHLIESRVDESELLLIQYRLIYMVHMPLFVFLSGLFMEKERVCFSQAKRVLVIYLISQFVMIVVKNLEGQKLDFELPYWHLWYLLSLSCWAAAAGLWHRLKRYFPFIGSRCGKLILLFFAFFGVFLAKNFAEIGREWSLSRTIAFLPWFLLGMFCPKEICWKKYRGAGVAGAVTAAVVIYFWGNRIPTGFLYQAAGYQTFRQLTTGDEGIVVTLLCCLLAFSLGIFLLTMVPERRLPVTKIGVDTLWIYLLHAPFVKLFMKIPWSLPLFPAVAPLAAVYIICLLYKLFQWRTTVCGIV
ncbi:MAG: acyltransferase family protein [Lachnospiraceae bacterium]|nr:acyltransferase family protein [Lachnospiraceae bacterium]